MKDNKPTKKASYRFYTTFMLLGDMATALMIVLVLKKTGFDYSMLWWMIPLLVLIEFGCYAERDRKHDYGK